MENPDEGGLDLVAAVVGETRSDSGCIWKVEPTGFASRLAEGGEREKS